MRKIKEALRRTKDEGRKTNGFNFFSSLVPRPSSFVNWLLILFIFSISGCGKMTGIPMGNPVGGELTAAQKFTLKNLDGGVTELNQLLSQKKLVLINFWATWCGYCVEEMPDLVKLQAANESRGFTVLAVNVGESGKQVSDFAKKMGLNFPIVLDEDNAVSQSYGLVGIPVSYLVGSTGKVLGEYHGFTPKLVSDIEGNLTA